MKYLLSILLLLASNCYADSTMVYLNGTTPTAVSVANPLPISVSAVGTPYCLAATPTVKAGTISTIAVVSASSTSIVLLGSDGVNYTYTITPSTGAVSCLIHP